MENSKVILSNFGRKMKYSDIIGYVNDVENDDINIFCNLDIFFDETILKLNEHNIDNHFIALTRWNINVDTKQAVFFNNHYSQDTWIWKGKVDLNSVDLDFEYGRPGCDNAICGSFHVAGYKVINPSLDIKTYHLHQDTTRSYTDADVVRKKLYFLFPTKEWDKSLIQYWKDCTNI
jgi:hypothetical protein